MATYIDVGNSNIKIMDEKLCVHVFQTKSFEPKSITNVLLGSENIVVTGVVSEVVANICTLCQGLDKKFSTISSKSKFSFKHNLDGVGIDRLIAVEGGITFFDPPFVVVDAGTAITVDFVVKEEGFFVFKGGVIIPGFELCFKSLNDYTALLPRLKPIPPKGVYGADTMNAMNCGICFTITAGVKDIIKRTEDVLGLSDIKVIITGGAGKFLGDLLEQKHEYVENLMFRGMMNIHNGRGV